MFMIKSTLSIINPSLSLRKRNSPQRKSILLKNNKPTNMALVALSWMTAPVATLRAGAIALLVLLLSACSGVQVSTDYDQDVDFNNLVRYDWLPSESGYSGAQGDSPLMTERIVSAVDQQLNLQGYNKALPADFFVNFGITTAQRTDIRSYDNYGGYGPGWGWGMNYGYSGMAGGYTETYVDYYQQGTLIIDVIDPESMQLIWRGVGTKRLPDSTNAAERDKLVAEIVKSILAKFPPQPAG